MKRMRRAKDMGVARQGRTPTLATRLNAALSGGFTGQLDAAGRMRRMRFLLAIVLSCLASPMAFAQADGLRDHERAQEARARGEFIPLERILADAEQYGRMIEVELEGTHYEIEVLRADGVLLELEYDAYSGRLLHAEIEDDD